jgi:hypothetical protein
MPETHSQFGPLPTLRVHVRHPLHEPRQVAVAFWPEHEVPMIRQLTVRTNAHGCDTKRFFHHPTEALIILLPREDPHPAHAPIEHVKQHSPRRDSGDSWHGRELTSVAYIRQYMRLSVRRECVCILAGESPAWEGSLAQ